MLWRLWTVLFLLLLLLLVQPGCAYYDDDDNDDAELYQTDDDLLHEYMREAMEQDEQANHDSYMYDDQDASQNNHNESHYHNNDSNDNDNNEPPPESPEDRRRQREERRQRRQQQRKDALLVRKILHAFDRLDYYAVLGLATWDWLPAPVQKWARLGCDHISSQDIRKAYRSQAMLVHPDKNRHPRANHAFVALEEAYQTLSQSDRRVEYDTQREALMEHAKENLSNNNIHNDGGVVAVAVLVWWHRIRSVVGGTWGVMRTVVGPWAGPVSILALTFL